MATHTHNTKENATNGPKASSSPGVHRRRLSESLELSVFVEEHGVGTDRDVVEQQATEAQGLFHDVADAGRNYQQWHLPINFG